MTNEQRKRGRDLEFTFEVEVLGGEESKELRHEQTRAIRDLLLWVREQRQSNAEDSGASTSEGPSSRDIT